MTTASPPEAVTIVDGHVHLRDAHHLPTTLDALAAHAARHAAQMGVKHHAVAALLTEQTNEHAYDRIAAGQADLGGWQRDTSDDADEPVVRLRHQLSGVEMLIAPGRQWACAERLEVLTLLSTASTDHGLRDGMPIRDCIDTALDADAVVTLPWGFGKWTGARRALMLELVEAYSNQIALGDSAARPMGSSDRVLASGRTRNLRIIPGTDPLPIPSHATRAGSYGYWIPGFPPESDITAWLADNLPMDDFANRTIGRRDSLLTAVATQFRLKLKT